MMQTVKIGLLLVSVYMYCSFSSAYFVGKWTRGIDPRDHYSHNLGATNAFRTLGPYLGSLVLALDIGKAALCLLIARWALGEGEHTWLLTVMMAAIAGHMFPLYLTPLRGGKGIAVGTGALLVLMPRVMLILLLLFLFVLWATEYVSVASIAISSAFPFLVWCYYTHELGALVIATSMSALVIFMHRGNISRLLAGTESQIGNSREST